MKRVPEARILNIDGSIAPQLFQRIEGDLVYFDRINQHEGRFYRFKNKNPEVLFEVGEGQVEISDKGDFFLFKFNDETTVTVYSDEGTKLREMTLKGIYYDVVKDSFGNYVCLGNIDGQTIIRIINKMGVETGTINPNGILFGSCIQLDGDEIYLGGFDENNCFKVIRFNYIGNRSGEWKLNIDSDDRIISKILKHGDNLILAVTGKLDSLVILSITNGNYSEVYMEDLNLKCLLDFNIYGESIFILDGKKIYEFEIEDIGFFTGKKHRKSSKKDYSLMSYQYIMCSKGICDCIESGFRITALLFLIASAIIFFTMESMFVDFFDVLVLVPCFFWIIHYTTAAVRSMIIFMNKAARIDKLLTIYSSDYEGNAFVFPAYTGMLASSFFILLSFSRFNLIQGIIPGMLAFGFLYVTEKKLYKIIKSQNEEVIIELLQPEDERFRDYIQRSVEVFRKTKSEKICVDILLSDNPKENIIDKWLKSRKSVIRGVEELRIENNRITTVLDMSKRDIKYSRISIIMDYICFIKREVSIKEIEIQFKEDKG
jgi:hypothetical protein